MAACLKCGTPYEEGAAYCANCGAVPGESAADGLAALRQIRSIDASRPAAQPDHVIATPESVPDWLDLLLARYGEQTPDFAGLEPSQPAPPPVPAPEPSVAAAPVAEVAETGEPDLMAEIEHIKAATATAPESARESTGQPESVPPTGAEPAPTASPVPGDSEPEPETPRAAADWLADLKATETAAAGGPAGEPSPPETTVAPVAGTPGWLPPGPEKAAPASAASDLLPRDTLPPMSDESLDWLADLRSAREGQPLAEGEAAPSSVSAETGAAVPEALAPVEPPVEAEAEPTPPLPIADSAGEPAEAPGEAGGSGDWLTQLRSAHAEAESPPPEPAPMDLPTPEEATPAPPAAGEAVPDWLAELERTSVEADARASVTETEAPAESQPTPEEMPDWLRELGLLGASASATTPPGEPDQASATLGPLPEAPPPDVPVEPEVPDWLSRLVAVTSSEPEPKPALPEALGPSPAAATPPAPASPVAPAADTFEAIGTADLAPEEVPDWLRELEMIQASPTDVAPAAWEAPAAAGEVGEGEDEAPTWMDDLRPLRSLASGAAAESGAPPLPESTAPPAADESLAPEWLADLQSLVESPPEAAPTAPAISTGPLSPGQTTPDWLRELGTEPPGAAGVPGSGAEPGQLPDWLTRLRPTDLDAIPGVERMLVTPGTTPAELPATEEDVIDSLRSRLGVPRVPDVEGATLFRDIVTEPVAPVAEAEPPHRSALNTIIWALIVVAILLGIAILSLAVMSRAQDLLGGPAFQRFLETPAGVGLVASLETFRAAATTLPQDAVVVMGIDYSPATEAEMRPLAEMALRDLLAHRARVVTVSLRPEGAALAHQLLLRVADTYAYGERTLNLGYLPGEVAGLRSLVALGDLPLYAAPPSACRTLSACRGWQDVRGLDDVALMVEVADAATPVRWWLEQVSTAGVAPRPMLAAVSAVAAPEVFPYYGPAAPGPGRLQGLISGVTAAAAYELYLGRPGRAVRSIAAQSAAHLGLVVTALVGTFVGLRAQAVRD
jgi:hypothetical protein